MWQDQRGTDHSFAIMSRDESAFMTFVERHGIPPIGSGLSLGHILHLQLDRPDVHAATPAYVEAMDYVTARLTGRIVASQHTSFMVQCCDNRTLGATAYDDELVALAGVDASRLPPLVRVDDAVGPLLPRRRERRSDSRNPSSCTRRPTTRPRSRSRPARSPTAGPASRSAPRACSSTRSPTSAPTSNIRSSRCPGRTSTATSCARRTVSAARCSSTCSNGSCTRTTRSATTASATRSHQLDAVLDATEAGAGGVMFLPWLGGSLAPIASGSIRGGFVHMSLETGRADLVRAVVEGVAHNLAWLLPHVETFTGEAIREIVFVGGAARSAQWCQVLADVLDRRVSPLSGPDGGAARAMGLLALERHGRALRADLDRAAAGTSAVFEPDSARHERYAYRQVQFEAAHAALLPISEALSP